MKSIAQTLLIITVVVLISACKGPASPETSLTDTDPPSSADSTLSILTIDTGILKPDFSPEVTEYSVLVNSSVRNLTITNEANNENAIVSASPASTSSLSVGANEITITVTAEDEVSTTDYTITATRHDIIRTTFSGPMGVGYTYHYAWDDKEFRTKNVLPGSGFPMGVDDSGTGTVSSLMMGETEVTYEVWKWIYDWSLDNGYTFAHAGAIGGGNDGAIIETTNQPVTEISWRDAMVFCNAMTEWYNASNGGTADAECVYYTDSGFTAPIRISTAEDIGRGTPEPGSQDDPFIKTDAKGFRLPTEAEWECAARYINGTDWQPGDYASGAENGTVGAAMEVAWFGARYDPTEYGNTVCSKPVGTKDSNIIGCFDMSGNVSEYVFAWGAAENTRQTKGGSWYTSVTATPIDLSNLQVGEGRIAPPELGSDKVGFRIVRSR